ncbi:MAG TPA: Hpt domain-containing protein [Thermohalobaculum sp.]|nr:Hpt domain-containing protein [Thermohalobaculum sp.]
MTRLGTEGNGDGEYPDVDEAYLGRLADLLGEEKLREILSDGLIEVADRLEQVAVLAAENRRREIAAVAHDLVGTAGYLGLTRLSLAATDLERAARRGDRPLDHELKAVEELAEAAFAAMQPRLRGGAS